MDDSGRDLNFPTTKAQALLAYLLVEEVQRPGAGWQRGELMMLLWPDTVAESAQTNLRQTLYRLRGALPGVGNPSGEIEPFLIGNRQSAAERRIASHAATPPFSTRLSTSSSCAGSAAAISLCTSYCMSTSTGTAKPIQFRRPGYSSFAMFRPVMRYPSDS
jgi:hypothetical protein